MLPEHSLGQYALGKTLGRGTFGKVKVAVHRHTQQQVAVKVLEKQRIKDAGDVDRVMRELNILKRLRHPHIVQLYEVSPS